MAEYCLICNSTAVISKDAITTVVLLTGTLESFLLGMKDAQTDQPEAEQNSFLRQALARIRQGVSRATSDYLATMVFAQDMQKYQFRHYDYLCLRCGALFDQGASSGGLAPTAIIPSSTAPPSAQSTPRPSAGPHDPTASATD